MIDFGKHIENARRMKRIGEGVSAACLKAVTETIDRAVGDDDEERRLYLTASGIGHIMAGVQIIHQGRLPGISDPLAEKILEAMSESAVAMGKRRALQVEGKPDKPDEPCDCPKCVAEREAEAKEAERVKAADEQAAKWAAEEAEGKGNG